MQCVLALDIRPEDMKKSEDSAVEAYHKLMEAMKFAYGTWKYFGD